MTDQSEAMPFATPMWTLKPETKLSSAHLQVKKNKSCTRSYLIQPCLIFSGSEEERDYVSEIFTSRKAQMILLGSHIELTQRREWKEDERAIKMKVQSQYYQPKHHSPFVTYPLLSEHQQERQRRISGKKLYVSLVWHAPSSFGRVWMYKWITNQLLNFAGNGTTYHQPAIEVLEKVVAFSCDM